MDFEDIRVGKPLYRGEMGKGRIDAGRERCVLESPDDIEIFLVGEIA